MTRASAIVAVVVMLVVCGCAVALEPAPGVARVAGVGAGAVAEEGGVRVVARAQAWRGYPGDLRNAVTPILVTVDNGSSRPLSIRNEHFTLEGADGRTFAALPPFEIAGSVSEPVPYASAAWAGFAFGSPWPSGRLGWAFGGPFWATGPYYDPYYPAFPHVVLPTGDMVQKALPERTLEPGGRLTGFLYFEDVPRNARSVTFTMQLVEPGTPAPVGSIRIPFVVDRARPGAAGHDRIAPVESERRQDGA